jgi:hypothetical protein
VTSRKAKHPTQEVPDLKRHELRDIAFSVGSHNESGAPLSPPLPLVVAAAFRAKLIASLRTSSSK